MLRSDEVRKELAGIAPTARARAALDEGLYEPSWTSRTYAALCDRARDLLGLGHSVVLDASWSDPTWRRAASEVADECVADLIELRCDAPVAVAQDRAAKRAMLGTDASDVTPELIAALAARFPTWATAATLDTARPVPQVIADVLQRVGTF